MKKVTVFGAGKSGVAAANFLASRGTAVSITDSKSEQELPLAGNLMPAVRRCFGGHGDELLEGIDAVVLSPGIPLTTPILQKAKSRGLPILSEIELAFRHLQGKVVAITGSNGKSTTTALIGEILRHAGMDPVVAGNIGDPLVASIDSKPRTYVIELSSFQLETVDTFRADVALLLNITPDHMDRYDAIEDYAAAKFRVFRNQTNEQVAIVNADDPRTVEPPTKAKVLHFSSTKRVTPGAWLESGDLLLDTGGRRASIPRNALALSGTANVENALASWLAADALGVGDEAVKKAFETFAGLPHRMVMVRELEGVCYVNDSKGTNVDATLKSLEGFEDRRVMLILGGKDKNGEFERLRPLVERKARAILTIGSASEKIQKALEGAAEIVQCEDMSRAVSTAREKASRGDTVLLSPACASFDQYGNFEERGRHFEELVRGLR